MKKMMRLYLSLAACLISMSAASSEGNSSSAALKLGNEPGYSTLASGASIVEIHQGNCNYSIDLKASQYVKFNTPDVVFLESETPPKEKDWPYLEQAEMSAGYDWNFKKDDNLKSKWFGLMCDGIGNFDFQSNGGVGSEEDSPELQDVKQSNGFKCPATLTDNGWVPNKNAGRPDSYFFQKLSGAGWSGFVLGFKGGGGKNIARVSFCIVQGENVLVGAAENQPRSLSLSEESFDGMKSVLESIQFLK